MEKFRENKASKLEVVRDKARKKIILGASIFFLSTVTVMLSKLSRIEDIVKEDFIEYVEKNISQEELDSLELEEKINYLIEELHSHVFIKMISSNEKNKEDYSQNPQINGFEKKGINNNIFKKLWNEKYYPKGTIVGQLKEIKYEDSPSKSSYTDGENSASVDFYENDVITFYGTKHKHLENVPLKHKVDVLDMIFSHELGHINDWVGKNNLSLSERINFLHDITKAFSKEGSFRDIGGYINGVSHKKEKLEKYIKVSEYWAVLCEYYLTFPDIFEANTSLEEKKLINKWFVSENIDFNNTKKFQERKKIIESI